MNIFYVNTYIEQESKREEQACTVSLERYDIYTHTIMINASFSALFTTFYFLYGHGFWTGAVTVTMEFTVTMVFQLTVIITQDALLQSYCFYNRS